MKTIQTITDLDIQLLKERKAKLTAALTHKKTLMSGIETLKTVFEDIPTIKKLNQKEMIAKVQKRLGYKVSNDTKRILRIAHKLIQGYKVKKELLTIAQIENTLYFSKSKVNSLMTLDGKEYIDAIRGLISEAKVEITSKIFKPKEARKL